MFVAKKPQFVEINKFIPPVLRKILKIKKDFSKDLFVL